MGWNYKSPLRSLCLCLSPIILLISTGCSISYRFNGGTIDYTRIKSISISEVHNRASIIYPTLAPMFTERIKDMYTSRTRLEQVARNGDLELEIVITGYDLATAAVGQDNYADRTTFTVTVEVSYTNNDNPKESFQKRSFRAFRDFSRNQAFNSVQDQLLDEIVDDLIKQIFNATIENW